MKGKGKFEIVKKIQTKVLERAINSSGNLVQNL